MEKEMIPLSIPNLCGNELKYVTRALLDGWVSSGGGDIATFETNFAAYVHADFACACQSGTAGLHLCLRHFGIGENDIVLVPTLTFIATINSVMYQRAVPVFIDCDDDMQIDAGQIRRFLEEDCLFDGQILKEKESGRTIKAIIPVHVFGDTCDMDSIMDISQTYGLVVIEDATESLGSVFDRGKYKDRHAGTVGHAGVCSFNGNKIITTGGGGMVFSDDAEAIGHMRYLSTQAKDDAVYFVHNEYGYNYRMTNIQASIGIAQLELLDDFIQKKKENFAYYSKKLDACEYAYLKPFKTGGSANHWFYSFVLNTPDAQKRDALIHWMDNNNIQTRPIWKLNHTQKPLKLYRCVGAKRAERFYKSIVNIPCSTSLTHAQIDRVCSALVAFCE